MPLQYQMLLEQHWEMCKILGLQPTSVPRTLHEVEALMAIQPDMMRAVNRQSQLPVERGGSGHVAPACAQEERVGHPVARPGPSTGLAILPWVCRHFGYQLPTPEAYQTHRSQTHEGEIACLLRPVIPTVTYALREHLDGHYAIKNFGCDMLLAAPS